MKLKNNESLHIAMFPWVAFGHMMPFLELSKSLAKRGHRISYISTSRNIKRLPQIPHDLSHLFNFVSLPLPKLQTLPEEAEATSDIPFHLAEHLKKAFDGLESPLTEFLESSSPDWIIYDFVPYWLPPITAGLGIRSVYYSIYNASFLTFIGPPSANLGGGGGEFEGARATTEAFTALSPWVPFENNIALRMFEIMKMIKSVGENASGVTDVYRFASIVQGSDAVAIRSSTEVEPEWLSLLEREVYKKPVIPVGLFPPRVKSGEENDEQWVQIKDWLDKKEEKSVVYVAFGSEAMLSQEEATELALGLELSELPFFWVLRTPVGTTEPQLPTGLEERVKGRGFICKTWAPQLRILSHRSVGGFLSHSGWSSVIESLGFGCPLVLLPLINDQGLVARLLTWKKIAFEVPRDESDGSFTRNDVAKSLRKLLVDQEGESYRVKAKELKVVVGDVARQEQYIDDFARYLTDQKTS